jgi:hypothetical protein
LRYWTFVEAELDRHHSRGNLTSAEVEGIRSDIQERRGILETRLGIEDVLPVENEGPVRPKNPRRNLLDMLLDPRNIQWLLALGGTLMVTGLVILLWVHKYFTPPVVAASLGIANTAVLVGGWNVIRRTRYQTAGRALTLLACIIMPLNLWYYHTHGLLTIDGHLWVAAMVISALYLASAVVLRDELFVYVFVGGITLTGLLILADWPPSPQKFWEIASPSTLLVVLGLIALHLERAFPDQEGPFSRKRFGLAFFWSAHALLAAGLFLVLGAQIAADWMYQPVFRAFYEQWQAGRTPMVTETWGQILALCLVLAGTYAYLYSDIVVRRVGVYVYLAAGTLLWGEVLLLEVFRLHLSMDAMIAILAATGLLANLAQRLGPQRDRLTRPLPVLGLFLGLLAVVLGTIVYARALSPDLKAVWLTMAPSWTYVVAMLLTATACWVGAQVNWHTQRKLSYLLSYATGAATLLFAVALLAAWDLSRWQQHGPFLMMLPLAYLVAGRLYRGRSAEKTLVPVGHATAVVVLLSGLASAWQGFTVIREQQPLNLVLALFFAETALFYALTVIWQKQACAIHLCAAMGCAAVWQLFTFLGVSSETYTLTFAAVGLSLLVGHRLATTRGLGAGRLGTTLFQSANGLLSLSFIASLFIGLSRVATKEVDWTLVVVCLAMILAGLLAVALVRNMDWRRWYIVTSVAEVLVAILTIQVLSTLTIYQKLEIFSVAAGLALLVVGHIGWYREQESENELVTVSLLLGSLLAGVPLVIATLADRWHDHFIFLNEAGFLAVGVLLLATGVIFRLKSTTLAGGILTLLYFVSMLIYIPWSRLNTVAICSIAGGALLFATGLLLSVYRDRLRALPEKVKRQEGIFRIMSWR